MRRFELFGRFSFLIFAFLSLAVLFAPMAMAATVGFYAGTFDPPTQAEIGMIRCALGDASVQKECAGIGKTIARLVVSVNESSDEDTLASARERALMVKGAAKTAIGLRL
jgi:nicotinic acid mononucleotide adenylyltransferase